MQRRTGSGNWQVAAFIPTSAIDGNSQTDIKYAYTEVNSLSGATQYRIRQIDIDGRDKYSEIRSVRGEGQLGKMIVFPNPSNDGKVKVIFEDHNAVRDIMVTDMSGRTVKMMKGIESNSIEISDLAPGMYSMRVTDRETSESIMQKILVNKR